jgi:ERCC4-related helicase
MTAEFRMPDDLVLGTRLNERVPTVDQERQRREVEVILQRLAGQPGLVLADEVGMGKTFVALGVAYSVALNSRKGPVIVMVPSNLLEKWQQDLSTFCDLYVSGRRPVRRETATTKQLTAPDALRYGVAVHSIELLRLLDDAPRERCHLIFLAQRAMSRSQTDKWIRLALIGEALRRHARGRGARLIKVREQIHRFTADLIWALGEERAQHLGDELWQKLLKTDPGAWIGIYNDAVRDPKRRMSDDPVPKAVLRAIRDLNLKELATALEKMPVRAVGGDERVQERVRGVRDALRQVERGLWREVIAKARWRSPLLVMDEAHHLKNPGAGLARQLKSVDTEEDLKTGDGAMARSFDRMLFLTATPFQLGHHELVHVMNRFADIRWDEAALGVHAAFEARMADLAKALDDSQRTAIALQRTWSRLQPEDCDGGAEGWWPGILATPRAELPDRLRAVADAYETAKLSREAAERALRPWIVRHNKGSHWAEATTIPRRERIAGGALSVAGAIGGLPIPPGQLLPFFLAARSVVRAEKDLLGEALCSSFEAFRLTRQGRESGKDTLDEEDDQSSVQEHLAHAKWYLRQFDDALASVSGAAHPKVAATVQKVADLWEAGEKVLVFAFYRQTCRALRLHISREIERRLLRAAEKRLGMAVDAQAMERLLEEVRNRFFDDAEAKGRLALDASLRSILDRRRSQLDKAGVTADQRAALETITRRFLRVPTTLLRSFPIEDHRTLAPEEAVDRFLGHADGSGSSWRAKLDGFVEFVVECSSDERRLFIDACERTQTGGIRVEGDDSDDAQVTLANVQMATGETRRDHRARLMRSFNTPFFPDILVCSEVMGEGVDLQRFCRHVVHHDLAWNPSTIEQRTGRIDRLSCKAEGKHPIMVYLPYISGTADERQFQVMSDRERWFRVVMGQEEVAKLVTPDSLNQVSLPEVVANELGFKLGI